MTNKNLLKPFPLIVHFLMWTVYFVWVAWGNVARYGVSHLLVVVSAAPVMLGLVYLHRYWLRRLFLARGEWVKILLWLGIFAAVVGGSIYFLLYQKPSRISGVLLPDPEEQRFLDYLLDYINFYWKFAGIGVGLGVAEIFVNLLRERIQLFQAKRHYAGFRQKNKKLRKWIKHFAGNIKNSTPYSITQEVSRRQVASLEAVNGYVMELLARENIFWIPLEQELKYLERLREMFNKIPIAFDVPTETYQHRVLPLMLLVLYKNMCKHGDFDSHGTSASFRVTAFPDRLLVVTQNFIASEAMWVYGEEKTGLEQLKELLVQNHAERARLDYGLEGNCFLLRLEIIYNTESNHQIITNDGKKPTCVTGNGGR